jgi:hypothetical protein
MNLVFDERSSGSQVQGKTSIAVTFAKQLVVFNEVKVYCRR